MRRRSRPARRRRWLRAGAARPMPSSIAPREEFPGRFGIGMEIIRRKTGHREEGAHERARAIIAAAEDAVQRSRSEASRRIEETGGQFNELIRLKENLVVALRGVVGEFEEALSRVERGESLYGRSAPFASAPPPPHPAVPAAPPAAPFFSES